MKFRNDNPEDLKKKLAAFFQKREEVFFAYLFGSQAAGRTNPMSDIDIAVAVDPVLRDKMTYPYGYPAHLTGLLMSLLQTNNVDVVVLNEASPVFKYRISAEGIPIFCRDEAAEKAFYILAFRQYQDTLPLRQIQDFYLKQYLRNLGPVLSHGQS